MHFSNIVGQFFSDAGVNWDTPCVTSKQLILILAFVFSIEVLIRLISAITDLCRR